MAREGPAPRGVADMTIGERLRACLLSGLLPTTVASPHDPAPPVALGRGCDWTGARRGAQETGIDAPLVSTPFSRERAGREHRFSRRTVLQRRA